MAESDFHDLLQQAEQLAAEVEGTGQLPKVERTLHQMLDASTELWSRVTQTGAQDLQAHLLLGSKGVDLPQLAQKLEGLSARKTLETLEPYPDAHISSFLQNENENAILSIIEEAHKSCFEDCDKRAKEDLLMDWRRDKAALLNSLSESMVDSMDYSTVPEISVIGDSTSLHGKTMLDYQETAYMNVVFEYNKSVVQGALRIPIVEKFKQIGATLKDEEIAVLWEMVEYMTQVPPQAKGDVVSARCSPAAEQAFVSQARKYFEERFKKFMRRNVEGNLQYADRGSMPGTFPMVLSHVKLRNLAEMPGLEDGLVNGQPIWPIIYFCLRCGDIATAIYTARLGNESVQEFASILDELNKSPTRKLPTRSEQTVKFNYRRHVRGCADPYKKIAYCVVGGCGSDQDFPDIASTADDYLWLKLCQIRDEQVDDTSVEQRMSLNRLQSLILEEYGETHYNAHENPILYFQLLFFTAQFEAAIEFLSRFEYLRVHAVHIALALSENDLLSGPDDLELPILSVKESDRSPARRLNLYRLVWLYVRKFMVTDTREAIHYFFFLRKLEFPDGRNAFMVSVCELLMETHNFELVLGKLESDGCRMPGCIDFFHGVQVDVKQIAEFVAADCEKKGMYEDAIHLYDLAGNHDKVLNLLTQMLSQVVHQLSAPGTLRSRLQDMSYSIVMRYEGVKLNCSSETAAMFLILRDLLLFFDQYHTQDYELALETIARTKLIPLQMRELDEKVRNFRNLTEEISRCIPDVLMSTMNILFEIYKKVKGGDLPRGKFPGGSKDQHLQFLRDKAQAITSFAGAIPYHLPGDTSARLVEIEIQMN